MKLFWSSRSRKYLNSAYIIIIQGSCLVCGGDHFKREWMRKTIPIKAVNELKNVMIHKPEVKCDYFETMDIEIQLSELTTSLNGWKYKTVTFQWQIPSRYLESLFLNHDNSFLELVHCLYWTKDEEINTNEYIHYGFIYKKNRISEQNPKRTLRFMSLFTGQK